MRKRTDHEVIEYLKKEADNYTIDQLMFMLALTYHQLYTICHRNGFRPRDSKWCTRVVKDEKPMEMGPQKAERPPAVYSNTTPYGIAGKQ